MVGVEQVHNQAWTNFTRALTNPITRKAYVGDLEQYMTVMDVSSPDKLLVGRPEEMEDKAIRFITVTAETGASSHRLTRLISALKSFYDSNRVTLNWKFVRRHIPKGKRRRDEAYTHADILKALGAASIRNKVIILLLSSSGIRRGGLSGLKKKHLKFIDKYNLYQITVYADEEEEYQSFCTPEAKKAIDDYFQNREKSGERITEDSPLMRDEFNRNDPFRASKPRSITEDGISNAITEVMEKTGLRERITLTEGRNAGSIRHEKKAVHALRKFFNTQLEVAGIDYDRRTLLRGDRPKGVQHNYIRINPGQLLEGEGAQKGYLHALNYLTIDPSFRLEEQVRKLEDEKDELINDLQERMKTMERFTWLSKLKGNPNYDQKGIEKELSKLSSKLSSTAAPVADALAIAEPYRKHTNKKPKNSLEQTLKEYDDYIRDSQTNGDLP